MKLLWNFIKIQHQGPSRVQLFSMSLSEAWRTWRFLIDLEFWSYEWEHLYEGSMKFSSKSNIRNPLKSPHLFHVLSWGTSNIRSPVKTPPFLQVSSWSLGGHGGSWWTWSLGQMNGSIFMKLSWNFHQDPTSGTLSRLHHLSMSLHGVLEDIKVLDGPGVWVRWMGDVFVKMDLELGSKLLWNFHQDPT